MKGHDYNPHSQKIISVGRLSYPKNFELLIEIASEVFKRHPDWSWDIYGEGELHGELQSKIDAYHLQGQVVLKGQVSDIYDRYEDYAFMVMTSRYEGFPMTLLEGEACGLPMVSFDIKSGPNEIIVDGKNGFLVPSSNKQAMLQKIEELITDTKLRSEMSRNSLNMRHNFSLSQITQQWKQVFENLS